MATAFPGLAGAAGAWSGVLANYADYRHCILAPVVATFVAGRADAIIHDLRPAGVGS